MHLERTGLCSAWSRSWGLLHQWVFWPFLLHFATLHIQPMYSALLFPARKNCNISDYRKCIYFVLKMSCFTIKTKIFNEEHLSWSGRSLKEIYLQRLQLFSCVNTLESIGNVFLQQFSKTNWTFLGISILYAGKAIAVRADEFQGELELVKDKCQGESSSADLTFHNLISAKKIDMNDWAWLSMVRRRRWRNHTKTTTKLQSLIQGFSDWTWQIYNCPVLLKQSWI